MMKLTPSVIAQAVFHSSLITHYSLLSSARAGVGHVEHVVARDDARDASELFDEDGGTSPKEARDFSRACVNVNDGEGRLHHFADGRGQEVSVRENLCEQTVLAHGADRLPFLYDGHLRDAELVHLRERVGHSLRGHGGDDARSLARGLR